MLRIAPGRVVFFSIGLTGIDLLNTLINSAHDYSYPHI